LSFDRYFAITIEKQLKQEHQQPALTSYTTTVYPAELPQVLGGLDQEALQGFLENNTVALKYRVLEGIASGHHWSAVLAVRADGKEVRGSNDRLSSRRLRNHYYQYLSSISSLVMAEQHASVNVALLTSPADLRWN
jgi:hypothetical protein